MGPDLDLLGTTELGHELQVALVWGLSMVMSFGDGTIIVFALSLIGVWRRDLLFYAETFEGP